VGCGWVFAFGGGGAGGVVVLLSREDGAEKWEEEGGFWCGENFNEEEVESWTEKAIVKSIIWGSSMIYRRLFKRSQQHSMAFSIYIKGV